MAKTLDQKMSVEALLQIRTFAVHKAVELAIHRVGDSPVDDALKIEEFLLREAATPSDDADDRF